MLILWPPWAIWADMRSYINTSGTDDFIQRIYILLTSILLIGYTAQAAALRVELEVAGEPESEEQMSVFVMDDQGYKTLQWAVAFFLLARLLRLALTLGYAWFLPKFRAAHLVQAANILVPCLCFLPLFAIRSVSTAMAVFIVGVVCEIAGKYLAALVISWIKARNPENVFVPAQEIGHAIEKTSAFFVLMCGEILFGTLLDFPTTFSALRGVQLLPTLLKVVMRSGQTRKRTHYIHGTPLTFTQGIRTSISGSHSGVSSCLGTRHFLWLSRSSLLTLSQLYFDADSSRFYIHALR